MRVVSIALYGLAACLFLALELLSRRDGAKLPRLGQLIGFAARYRAARIGLYLLWWWVGWHFLAR